jgi:hypothetical protein
MTQTLSPQVTIDPTVYRYVIGFASPQEYSVASYSGTVKAAFIGARVTYELPSGAADASTYLPAIQR